MTRAAKPPPLVSACVITYGQQATIAQTVTSILSQQCGFGFEVIVGEDCSPDGTLAVLRGLEAAHPGRLTVIAQSANLGFMGNVRSVFAAASGEFITILEGDDYWRQDDKLGAQVAALRAHPELDVVFSSALVEHPDGSQQAAFDYGPQPRHVSAEELCRQPSMMAPTASLMFRRSRLESLPDTIYDAPVLDAFLLLGLAARGGAWYLPQATCTYRLGAAGSWTERMAAIGPARLKQYCAEMIAAYETNGSLFGLPPSAIASRTRGLRWDLLRLLQREGAWAEVLGHGAKLGPTFLFRRAGALLRRAMRR